MVITIDAGTTNTRVFLIDGQGRLAGQTKEPVGVRDTAADGNNGKLARAVKNCMDRLMEQSGICWRDVETVLAGGMITSNLGLAEIPHLTAPVGLADLARGITPVNLSGICPLPIHFIPGVKNNVENLTLENFEQMDMMRGEEVETFAILEDYPPGREYLIVLPGSHNKFVFVDRDGRITGCLTTLSGELLDSITRHTIISDAVGGGFADVYDRDMVMTGYRAAKAGGLSRAAFSARILSQNKLADKNQTANYLLGLVLAGDVQAVCGRFGGGQRIDGGRFEDGRPPDANRSYGSRSSHGENNDAQVTVVIGGGGAVSRAFADLFLYEGIFTEAHIAVPKNGLPFSAAGALALNLYCVCHTPLLT